MGKIRQCVVNIDLPRAGNTRLAQGSNTFQVADVLQACVADVDSVVASKILHDMLLLYQVTL